MSLFFMLKAPFTAHCCIPLDNSALVYFPLLLFIFFRIFIVSVRLCSRSAFTHFLTFSRRFLPWPLFFFSASSPKLPSHLPLIFSKHLIVTSHGYKMLRLTNFFCTCFCVDFHYFPNCFCSFFTIVLQIEVFDTIKVVDTPRLSNYTLFLVSCFALSANWLALWLSPALCVSTRLTVSPFCYSFSEFTFLCFSGRNVTDYWHQQS